VRFLATIVVAIVVISSSANTPILEEAITLGNIHYLVESKADETMGLVPNHEFMRINTKSPKFS
jgi:hypothetical protein